jgi:centrosomal protein CEP120
VLVYLEDAGEASHLSRPAQSLQKAREQKMGQYASSQGAFGANFPTTSPEGTGANSEQEYQAVWQLEMWKRAEEAKFKAYLRQREIEKIEEITFSWKQKEQEREATFNESMKSMDKLDATLRQKALDLQRREERIIQLEEELKHKINEVSRQLANKEEEIINIKKKFKEEKNQLEHDKKRATNQVEDLKNKLEAVDKKFYAYKLEVEQSPLNVLRNELAQKNIEVVELETKVN